MQKEVVHKLVIDRCPKCRGVWLDPQELDAIKKTVTQEGYRNGFLLGMAAG
jgi:Zn-finger nucleic acid-binding protein